MDENSLMSSVEEKMCAKKKEKKRKKEGNKTYIAWYAGMPRTLAPLATRLITG